MIRNKNIVCSDLDVSVPASLNFGEIFLKKLLQFRYNVCFNPCVACSYSDCTRSMRYFKNSETGNYRIMNERLGSYVMNLQNTSLQINGATEEKLTYGEILQQAMNAAISLARMGVGQGQTVAVMSENRNEFFPAVTGVICSGAVVTLFNVGYTEGEVKHVINISKPTCIICSPTAFKSHSKTFKSSFKTIIVFGKEKYKNTVSYNSIAFPNNVANTELFNVKTKELSRNIRYEEFQVPDVDGQTDTLMILYSSGTTGLPKGVMLTHLNVLSACYQQNASDVTLLTLTVTPWYHTMGIVGNIGALFTGRTAIYLPKFEPQLYLNIIEKYKVAQLTVVPPILVLLTKLQFHQDVTSVRAIQSGAAPLLSDTVNALKTKFPNAVVFQGYGMTEVTLAVTRDVLEKQHLAKIGGVGIPVGAVRIKVADLKTGEALGPYKQGEICVKGPMVMKGYVGMSMDSWKDNEGYFRTGDIGYYDEDYCFFIVDRLKELIKYKGYQVPPAEIEAVLLTHPAVKDAGVVAKEHSEGGEVPVAFIVRQPRAGVTEDELKEFVAERLSNPKHLRGGVIFVELIPKSVSGKILRKELKMMLKSGRSKL